MKKILIVILLMMQKNSFAHDILPAMHIEEKLRSNAESVARYELWRIESKNLKKQIVYFSDFELTVKKHESAKMKLYEYCWTIKKSIKHLPSNNIYVYVSSATPDVLLYWKRSKQFTDLLKKEVEPINER